MPNRTLKTLFLYSGLFVFAGSLLGPLYALYVSRLNAGILSVSITWAVFLSAATLFTFLFSRIGDKFKNKRYFLAASFLIRGVGWGLMIYVPTIEYLVVLQLLLGLGEALGNPAFDTILAEHLDRGKHIMDYSDWKVVCNAFLVVGTLLGGLIVQRFGFDILLIIMASIAIATAAAVLVSPNLDSKKT